MQEVMIVRHTGTGGLHEMIPVEGLGHCLPPSLPQSPLLTSQRAGCPHIPSAGPRPSPPGTRVSLALVFLVLP